MANKKTSTNAKKYVIILADVRMANKKTSTNAKKYVIILM